ncbi:hypothetical protein H5410_002078 [Solanum commersonii]|uniref:Uncharacterized protein n=1 Tax=Solanum commersonii TaxID=4109 RepID=A0A9J6B0Z1_SOLCO|nr:hypothetical protein H5410_002078 [Solanum commersonii]
MVHSLKLQNQMQRSHSQRRIQCIISPIGLPVFSNQHLLQLTQDQKDLFKAYNGAERKALSKSSVLIGTNTQICEGTTAFNTEGVAKKFRRVKIILQFQTRKIWSHKLKPSTKAVFNTIIAYNPNT